MIKSNLVLLVSGPLLSAYMLTGCATSAQTGAAAMAGGLLGTNVAILALTNSKLEVTVDMYGPTEEQRREMRLQHPTALMQSINDRRQAAVDPVQNPTAQNMMTVSVALRPVMGRIEKTIAPLDWSIKQLEQPAKISQNYKNVRDTMEGLNHAAVAEVKAWKDFDGTMNESMQRLDEPTILRTLAFKLSVLRESLIKSAGAHIVTTDYIDFLTTEISAALVLDLGAAKPPIPPDARSKIDIEIESKLKITDNPAATDPERIGIVLDAVRQLLGFTSNHEKTNDTLRFLGISLNIQKLLALGSEQAIVSALTPSISGPEVCEAAAAVIALPACSTVAYSYTFGFSRATADYNSGPISNEVAQVLQAANRGLSIISDPVNANRWRLSANAKSRGGAGNQNSVIYFENIALPIVKSSAFDPTKFVVAEGALYRQVFAASVAAFGVPLPGTAGTPGAPDMQSSNIIVTKARILNAEKATAAAQKKILDALKATIDEQKKVASAKSVTPALIAEAQGVLQGVATQLETVAGAN